MTPKETLLKQIADKEVTLYSQVGNKFVIRYLGLMWVVIFDDEDNVITCDPRDIDQSVHSLETYLIHINKFNHSFVVVDNFFKIMYIEPKEPQPWMKANILSIPEFWWAVYRFRTDSAPDNEVCGIIESLPSTKFYTRDLRGEPVLVTNPNYCDVTSTIS